MAGTKLKLEERLLNTHMQVRVYRTYLTFGEKEREAKPGLTE